MSELFAPSSDDVSSCEEALPPASFASIAKPPVLFGGSSDDELSPLRPVDGASKPARALPDQFAREEEASAVRDLLYEPQLASFRELAQRHHVDYRWLLDLSMGKRQPIAARSRGALQSSDATPPRSSARRSPPVHCLHLVHHVGRDSVARESEQPSKPCRDNRFIHS